MIFTARKVYRVLNEVVDKVHYGDVMVNARIGMTRLEMTLFLYLPEMTFKRSITLHYKFMGKSIEEYAELKKFMDDINKFCDEALEDD